MSRKMFGGRARWPGACLALCLVVAAAGCGSKGTISGKVTYQGNNLNGGTVTFVSEKTGQSFSSPIEKDGTYTMSKVPAGTVKIAVSVPEPKGIPGTGQPQGGGRGGRPSDKVTFGPPKDSKFSGPPKNIDPTANKNDLVKIPPDYSDVEKSNLTYVVVSGKQEHDIPLK
jgi:hypothetical protein